MFVRSKQSDGVFAGTYASDFANAGKSQDRVNEERAMTLKYQQKMPSYQQARQARQGM